MKPVGRRERKHVGINGVIHKTSDPGIQLPANKSHPVHIAFSFNYPKCGVGPTYNMTSFDDKFP